jgi:hypothetical protein
MSYRYVWGKWVSKKPNRKDLLIVLTELQGLIGMASGFYNNDRDPNGPEKGAAYLAVAHNLCIEARGYDKETLSLNIPVYAVGLPEAGNAHHCNLTTKRLAQKKNKAPTGADKAEG